MWRWIYSNRPKRSRVATAHRDHLVGDAHPTQTHEFTAKHWQLVAMVDRRLRGVSCYGGQRDALAASIRTCGFVIAQSDFQLAGLARRRARTTGKTRASRAPRAEER